MACYPLRVQAARLRLSSRPYRRSDRSPHRRGRAHSGRDNGSGGALMAKQELLNAKHVIGLDIGDGESALAWLSTDDDSPVRIYQRQSTAETSILTALARDPDTGGYLFGEEALLRHGWIQFTVNFKHEPTAGKMANRDAVLFAQALLEEFFEAHAQVREACVVFIGHPAGWSATAVKKYGDQLGQLGLPVYLLAESQSALVHVRD